FFCYSSSTATQTTETYTLSLHDALPISGRRRHSRAHSATFGIFHPGRTATIYSPTSGAMAGYPENRRQLLEGKKESRDREYSVGLRGYKSGKHNASITHNGGKSDCFSNGDYRSKSRCPRGTF